MIGRQEIDKVWIRKLILVASLPMATVLVTTQIPEAARARYPDAVIRTALQSLTVRPTVPVEEQLALVPFKVSELAGFKVAGVIPGRAVMLGEPHEPDAAPAAATAVDTAYHGRARTRRPGADRPIATTSPATCSRACPTSRASASPARNRCASATSKATRSWPPRQDAATGAELTIVQWLRFGGGAYLQLVGVARTDAWREAYQRFRAVRDGIELR